LLGLGQFVTELIDALDRQDVDVEAVNSEYSDGQLELSFALKDPVAAADASVPTRLTIHTCRRGMGTGLRLACIRRPDGQRRARAPERLAAGGRPFWRAGTARTG
jgi:glutamine synthetase